MKKISCAAFVLLCFMRLGAQNITAAEYFFDADPGPGMATPVAVGSPGAIVNFTASVSTASLSKGFHTLAFRVKDENSIWSLFESRVVYISGATTNTSPIVAAEYFIDNDPGVGAGTPVSIGASGNTVNFTAIIPTASLSTGFHTLAIRTQNADGLWGLFETRAFYVSGSSTDASGITAAEYFIDADPGAGNGTPMNIGASGNTVQFTSPVPTLSLATGFHTLAIRVRNAAGVWSLFETRAFYISTATSNMGNIVAAEYFLDTDPGVGNGSPLSFTNPGPTVSQTFSLALPPGTASGTHTFVLRVRDANGVWGLFDTASFVSNLPLDWLSFTGQRMSNKVALQWITENEINTSHFIIERSKNGIDFSAIGQTPAKGGVYNNYFFDDLQPSKGLLFYRIKQVDRDGAFKYSIIIHLYFGDNTTTLKLYPNPASEKIMVEFGGRGETVVLQLYDATGKMIRNTKIRNQPLLTVNLENLPRGSYWIVLSDGLTLQNSHFTKQ